MINSSPYTYIFFIIIRPMSRNESQLRKALLQEVLHQNVIKVTREIIRPMNEEQRFEKARSHIMDALKYKHPRFESQSLKTPHLFKFLYTLESSWIWEWLLFFCGYLFLCFVVFDNDYYHAKIIIESIMIGLFWVDVLVLRYCKQFDNFVKKTKYSSFFYFKLAIIILMTLDLIWFIAVPCFQVRPIRPFRLLRCFVPILFDAEMRKSLISLASAYKDVLVYFIFFAIIIVGYALIGSNALTFDPKYQDPVYPIPFDQYKSNYGDLKSMIFLVYVTATYDSYPDNQLLAIQNYQPNYIYYIIFIFMNMFLFSSIPGSLIYLRYRDTRSKILLIDEIRQQHSLILAFVTLAENESNLPIDKLIKFLLYLYRYKIRYISYVTDICLKLDDHNNHYIQVNQFMQFSKILLENSAMFPPTFDDVSQWVNFRKFLNKRFGLKSIVKHWGFSLTISIIILMSFVNDIFFIQSYRDINEVLNTLFISLFVIELFLRILAIGPENFFAEKWNTLDAFIITLSFVFSFFKDSHVDGFILIWRVFRIATLMKIVTAKLVSKEINFQVYTKLKNIFETILEIMPIILRFMPLFVFFFYIYAIIGIEIFYNIYSVPGSSNYNQYQQFSNFKSFVSAQYVLVQILTQAGWSQIAFDHSYRAPDYFVLVMLFFCFLHITIVYIIATLIKGIFWEVFFTVNTIYAQRKKETTEEEIKEKEFNVKTAEIMSITEDIEKNEYIEANTIIRRELIENKFDQEIFKKLKKVYENDKHSMKTEKSKNMLKARRLIDDWDLNVDDLSEKSRYRYKKQSINSINSQQSYKSRISIHQTQQIDEQDLDNEIQELLGKLLVNPNIKYHQIVAHPRLFTDFLRSKFKRPEQLIKEYEFNLHEHPLHNQESMYYHIYEINALLNIQISKREQKALIIKSLVQEGIIDEEHAERLIKKKLHEKIFNIDSSGTIRKMFLQDTNEELIRKFQTEYFSDLYGYSFKHINKMTLQPLLKFQATLTYSLRNIMRYPQINNTQFFEMITNIQDQISNQLFQRGSLFKFVYKLNYEGDVWFSIEYKRQQEMRIHFIKSGIWCYSKDMKEKQVLYARDVFNWDLTEVVDRNNCEKYLKRFYQSFEGLAFSLLNQEEFFECNPKDHVYDLFIQHFDVDKTPRLKAKKLEISKIMLVILAKEEERSDLGQEPLSYTLSEIKVAQSAKKKKNIGFKLDESDDETFQKLKNLAAMEVQKIVQSEGLPFSYIVNLMREISDIITIYAQNFVYQIEKVLNQQYQAKKEELKHDGQEEDSKGSKSSHNNDHLQGLQTIRPFIP